MLYSFVTELIGNTPLLELKNLRKQLGLKANIFAKLEFYNPAGSVKDRVAARMIADAEKSGKLKKGSTIIEPTSGNTGIGLASVAAAKGYKAIIVMPDSMSLERRALMKAYGAELVLTPGAEGMSGAIKKAEELAEKTPDSFIAGQFINPSNPAAHFDTTGPEIWRDLEGKVDVFLAGVGTGGTFTGCGEFLKSKSESIELIAIEPASSPLLSCGTAGAHKIQGIGANFVPEIFKKELANKIIAVTDEDAINTARIFGKTEGVLCGISGGANLFAAISLAKKDQYRDKNIVTIIPDNGDHYLTAGLYN